MACFITDSIEPKCPKLLKQARDSVNTGFKVTFMNVFCEQVNFKQISND